MKMHTKSKFFPSLKSPFLSFLPSPDQQGKRVLQFVAFSSHDLPHPAILDTHFALAKILHASGKAEQIDRIVPSMTKRKGGAWLLTAARTRSIFTWLTS